MRICDRAAVRRRYPRVPPAAIDHLLTCIERAAPLIDAGDLVTASGRLAVDLDQYTESGVGPVSDLARLGAMEILGAMANEDRTRAVAHLVRLGLIADGPEPDDATLFVVVGPALDARVWAAARTIAFGTRVVSVASHGPAHRLHGLDPHRVAIVVLAGHDPGPEVEQQLNLLQIGGAAVLPASWREPDQPRLDVRT